MSSATVTCGNHSGAIVKTIPANAKTRSPSRRNHRSPSARNAAHLHPGTLFTFIPESRSPSPGIPISSLRLGWYSWESKQYEPSVTLDEQVELLSLIGDVALKDGKPMVHAHAVIGRKDGTAHGGHLFEAHIRPTCEVVLTESPSHLQKQVDPESGLAVIKL
jgi:hypothetical protein